MLCLPVMRTLHQALALPPPPLSACPIKQTEVVALARA